MPLNIEGYEIRDQDVRMYEQTNIVRSGLVLHLDASIFNTVTYGTTWFDLSGNGNNGTLTNGPTYSSIDGGIINFDGSNDYVRIATFTNTPQSTMTLLYWINFTQQGYIAQQSRNDSDADSEWMFGFDSGKLLFWDYDNGYGFSFVTSNTTLSTNIWYQVGFVKNGTSGIFYLNGVQDGSATAALNATYGDNDYVMGFDYRDNSNYFNGNIAQVQIYNRALTATEIAHNYNVTKGRFGL